MDISQEHAEVQTDLSKKLVSIMMNYLRAFIPNLSSLSALLQELVKNSTVRKQADALNAIKKIVISPSVRVNFNDNKPSPVFCKMVNQLLLLHEC